MGVAMLNRASDELSGIDLVVAADRGSELIERLRAAAKHDGSESRVFLLGGGKLLSVWGCSSDLGPAWNAVSAAFPTERAKLLEWLLKFIRALRGELSCMLYPSQSRSEIEVHEDLQKLNEIAHRVDELGRKMDADKKEIEAMKARWNGQKIALGVEAESQPLPTPKRAPRLAFFKVVFGKPTMVIYSEGLNSQNAIERACETLMARTGNDYRRCPSVAYDVGNLSQRERDRLQSGSVHGC